MENAAEIGGIFKLAPGWRMYRNTVTENMNTGAKMNARTMIGTSVYVSFLHVRRFALSD